MTRESQAGIATIGQLVVADTPVTSLEFPCLSFYCLSLDTVGAASTENVSQPAPR